MPPAGVVEEEVMSGGSGSGGNGRASGSGGSGSGRSGSGWSSRGDGRGSVSGSDASQEEHAETGAMLGYAGVPSILTVHQDARTASVHHVSPHHLQHF